MVEGPASVGPSPARRGPKLVRDAGRNVIPAGESEALFVEALKILGMIWRIFKICLLAAQRL